MIKICHKWEALYFYKGGGGKKAEHLSDIPPPIEGLLVKTCLHPSEISTLGSYLPLKFLASFTTLLHIRISNDHLHEVQHTLCLLEICLEK